MALKDLKSDLKDLSFGKGTAYDRPGQGFSMEPFIKGGINLGGTSTLNTITDGFIRGGALMHLERKAQDTVRFGKFLITPSFGFGIYDAGGGKKLGNNIEFRTTIEISYQLENKNRIGLSFGHISNAGLGDDNPGVEILSLSYQIPY